MDVQAQVKVSIRFYGDSIDGRSKAKAYTLLDGNMLDSIETGTVRATRIWLDMMLRRAVRKCVDWSLVPKDAYLDAMRRSVTDPTMIRNLLAQALTERINDRETFMKGIDYSYYYEQP